MTVYPAIDLMGGRAVRLRQGDPARRSTVGHDPVALARHWAAAGARWLHVVDLDAAMAGAPRHLALVAELCRVAAVPVQLGGGLRTIEDLRAAFDAGAARAVLGTAALDDALLAAAVGEFGDRLAVAVDARGGRVAADGWRRISSRTAIEHARRLAAVGVRRLVYTDVARDGMLGGPDVATLEALVRATGVAVIASGGIASADDLRAVAAAGAEGAIVGRALYEGYLTLAEALAAAGAA
ncbi:MAG: 1-(5-phosphoribosyl)-5-[(5-phosphoribosylamino)methylideneamino]imidazole-4-carboxamide isomerase [Armatimonadota bacterium]|nr:1-(5-phosphoribosyl)-5-[(5-phosphoribosylamino)methylideneamino]imidazole-4-carboxamide isomerase [Armatimonadota bacterium]